MLTKEQEAEAFSLYRMSKLTPEEKALYGRIGQAQVMLKLAQGELKSLQDVCPHPLIMREATNHGNGGTYDDPEGTYWTAHVCTMCDLRWSTDQGWSNTGDRRGLPKSGSG